MSLRISFPQYAAVMERTETDATATITVRCPLCSGEVTRRTFEMPTPYSQIVAARDMDREAYWRHLVTSHPERFDEGVAS